MFERVGSLAERVATEVSRRAFLGRLGQNALGLAAVIGGVLALPSKAQAADRCCVGTNASGCFYYKVQAEGYICINSTSTSCSNVPRGCTQVKGGFIGQGRG
jgi:hypothetical protein